MAYLGNEPQKDTVINVKKYIAEEGQTTFNAVYQDYVNVTVNGLSIDEYTADDGMTVVLDSPLSAGDKVKIEGFSSLAYLNSYVKSETDVLLDAKADTTYVDANDLLRVPKTGIQDTDDWDGVAYIDPDAIGANPQAKIYPDGTIVGSTDNGEYVKYPNGDLTCSKLANGTSLVILNVRAGGFSTAAAAITHIFPVAFIGLIPRVLASGRQTEVVSVMAYNITNTQFTPLLWRASSGTFDCFWSYEATGRWK